MSESNVIETNDDAVMMTYEALFQHRFTEADPEYMEAVRKPDPRPPTVDNWYTRPKRTFDWAGGRGRGSHSDQRRGDYRGGRSWHNDNQGDGRDYRDDRGDRGYRGNRGGYGGGYDGGAELPSRSRVHYAGVRESEPDDGSRPAKYPRRDDQQQHHSR